MKKDTVIGKAHMHKLIRGICVQKQCLVPLVRLVKQLSHIIIIYDHDQIL